MGYQIITLKASNEHQKILDGIQSEILTASCFSAQLQVVLNWLHPLEFCHPSQAKLEQVIVSAASACSTNLRIVSLPLIQPLTQVILHLTEHLTIVELSIAKQYTKGCSFLNCRYDTYHDVCYYCAFNLTTKDSNHKVIYPISPGETAET